MADERRRSERKPLYVEVYYEGAGVRAESRTSDISLTGVFIDALSPPPVGSDLVVRFSLPGGHLINTEVTVMYSQPGIGMGVRFKSLPPGDAQHIFEFINPDHAFDR